jgi:ABC-type tungstate transport system substrate-binding protein
MAGFGSVISEVGASMMVGGNIRGQTRVLTTAIVLETSKGEFGTALALSTYCWYHISHQSRVDVDPAEGS